MSFFIRFQSKRCVEKGQFCGDVVGTGLWPGWRLATQVCGRHCYWEACFVGTGSPSTAGLRNDSTNSLVVRPGVVAVDTAVRKTLLGAAGLAQMCTASRGAIPYIDTLHAPRGYGLDDRYNAVSAALRNAGTDCFSGATQSCRAIQQSAVRWATQYPVSSHDFENIYNDTLTINMRLLVPMLAALGIAEATAPMPRRERNLVDPWLATMVKNFSHGLRAAGRYNLQSHGITARRAAHNHAMQSSLAAMSYGAWVGDDAAFNTGLTQWRITLDSMRNDGSLPVETRRGARALFYQGRAIAALIQIAERAAVQGIDLYSQSPSPQQSLHQAVDFFSTLSSNRE